MMVVQSRRNNQGPQHLVAIPSVVLAALDQLATEEQEAVRLTLNGLRHPLAGEPPDPPLRRIAGDEPIYILRAAPQVLLFVRLDRGAPIEVVEIVRPETIRRMFPGNNTVSPTLD